MEVDVQKNLFGGKNHVRLFIKQTKQQNQSLKSTSGAVVLQIRVRPEGFLRNIPGLGVLGTAEHVAHNWEN